MTINILRYAGVYVIVTVAMALLSLALNIFLNLDISGAATIIPPVIAAAMIEGQRLARAHGRDMEKREAWRAAVLATVACIGVNLMLAAVLMMIPAVATVIAKLPMNILVGGAAAIAIIILLTNRWFIALGARSEIKRQAAQ